jgi:PAS domain S-box-containing protein
MSMHNFEMSQGAHFPKAFTDFRLLRRGMLRYGMAIVLVVAALGLSLVLHPFLKNAFLVFFLAAVMTTAWFGRTGPGLFSVAVSTMVVDYYFLVPYHAFTAELEEIPYLLSFLLSACCASWLASTRKQVEEKQRVHFDLLFEHGPEAIMLVDSEDRVQRINREFSRIFGYLSSEIVGGLSTAFIVPPDALKEARASRTSLAQGESVSMETVRRCKDGSTIHVSQIAVPVVVDGERISYYFIFRDITESKRAAEALQQAHAELAHLSRVTTMGELVATIAHEVNQPIAAVVTNANAAGRWLAQDPPKLDEVRDGLSNIGRDAARAGDVIGRIRALVRKSEPSMAALDINEIIRGVLVLLNAELRSGGVRVQTQLEKVPVVIGDRVQLQQVMLNLIINAIEAMSTIHDRPRQLAIRSLQDRELVLVQVRDSGIGFDAEHADTIFNPFFSTKAEGIGMGLTISQSIVSAHGGRLWATLAEPGAVLNFTVPVAGDLQ